MPSSNACDVCTCASASFLFVSCESLFTITRWATEIYSIHLVFYLFLKLAFVPQAANDCELEVIAYEFFTQAFVLYEEEVAVIAHL